MAIPPLWLLEQAQRQAGLFGQSPAPSVLNPPEQAPAEPGRLSFGQRLQRLIGGPASQQLSPEQNASAGQEAMIQAGLAALMASGQGQPTLAGLAMALSQGRQAGGAARQQIQQAQVRRQLANQAQQAGQAQLMSFFSEAIAAGDMESAKMAVDLIKATQGRPGSGFEFRTLQNRLIRVNPITGAAEVALEVPPEELQPKLSTPQVVVDRRSGRRALGAFDHRIGRYRDVNSGAVLDVDPESIRATTGREDRQSIAAALELAMEDLGRYTTAPNIVSQFLSTNPLAGVTRGFTSDDVQLFFAAKEQVQGLVTKLISGAQAAEAEVARLSRGFVPQAGEREPTVKRKLEILDRWVEALRRNPNADPWEEALRAEGRSSAEIERIMESRRRRDAEPSPVDPTNPFSNLVPEGPQ
jgi:hypothetical protein